MSPLQSAKLHLVGLLGLPKDALHIYVGLIVFLLSAALFRLPLRSGKPFLAVLLVTLAGEAWDLIDSWRSGAALVWARNWHDVWNTCFWPAILTLLARYTRLLKR